jgi:hypothetical protein
MGKWKKIISFLKKKKKEKTDIQKQLILLFGLT